ncbi:hypothetical protein XELAEV_18000890mg [Xenopus laevis]|nr:hypothetical protein XELAEV_18000890mg [Xenopus laevis]
MMIIMGVMCAIILIIIFTSAPKDSVLFLSLCLYLLPSLSPDLSSTPPAGTRQTSTYLLSCLSPLPIKRELGDLVLCRCSPLPLLLPSVNTTDRIPLTYTHTHMYLYI